MSLLFSTKTIQFDLHSKSNQSTTLVYGFWVPKVLLYGSIWIWNWCRRIISILVSKLSRLSLSKTLSQKSHQSRSSLTEICFYDTHDSLHLYLVSTDGVQPVNLNISNQNRVWAFKSRPLEKKITNKFKTHRIMRRWTQLGASWHRFLPYHLGFSATRPKCQWFVCKNKRLVNAEVWFL